MLTPDLLQMLFEELGEELGYDFEAWALEVGYLDTWTDQQIYNALPDLIKLEVGDIVMNSSWYHGGM